MVALASVSLAARTGILKDETVVDFVFDNDATSSSETTDIRDALVDFFNATTGTGFTLAHYIGYSRSRASAASKINIYDLDGHLDGSPHGSPTFAYTFTLGAGDTDRVIENPAQVALVLSFHADLSGLVEESGATRPRARRRGRVYIGPLDNLNANAQAVDGPVIPSDNLINTLASAASDLLAASGVIWSVWSRANAAVYEVVGGWVDNRFDTQRKRLTSPTIRTSWS